MLKEVLFLIFDIFLYAILLSIIQLGYFEKLVNKALIKIYGNKLSRGQNVSEADIAGDREVQDEKARVDQIVRAPVGKFCKSRVSPNNHISFFVDLEYEYFTSSYV